MLKVIKSNIEARHTSLQEGSTQVSLITLGSTQCNAIYLMQHQNYTKTTALTENSFLSVFSGTGELLVKDGDESFYVQIMSGDVFLIPHNTAYTISNIADQCLMISEITMKIK